MNKILMCTRAAVVAGGLVGGGVALAGVLWGGDAAGTTFIYSPIDNVERELGNLITF